MLKQKTQRLDYLYLLVLILIYAISYLDAGIILDNARDLYKVNQIISGQSVILQGPDLASAIHLSAWWFYWLSVVGIFHSKWLLVLWVGLTASMKFIFAYHLGKRWIGREFAFCLLLAMTLPGWHTLEQVTFSHTNVVQALTFLFYLILWKLWQSRNGSWLKWLALTFSMAVHAHPSTYGLLLFASPFLLYLLLKRVFFLKDIALSLIFAALTLAPYLLQQYFDNWHDFQTASHFGNSQFSVARIDQFFAFMNSLLYTGPLLFADVIPGNVKWWELLLRYVYLASLIVAVVGYLLGVVRKTLSLDVLLVLGWCLLSLGFCVLLIREIVPFYMTYILSPVIAMMIAYGLLQTVQLIRDNRVILPFLALSSVALVASTWFGMMRFSRYDELMLPDIQLRHVYARLNPNWKSEPNLKLDLLSVNQIETLGRLLCQRRKQQLHGPFVAVLDLSFGIPVQFACNIEDLSLSGNENGYALLSNRLYDSLQKRGVRLNYAANYAVIDNTYPLKPVTFSVAKPNDYQHPPRLLDQSKEVIHLTKTLKANAFVMITDYLSVYRTFSEPKVIIDGRLVQPISENYYTRIYQCDACQGDTANWEIEIENVNRETIDVVYFFFK